MCNKFNRFWFLFGSFLVPFWFAFESFCSTRIQGVLQHSKIVYLCFFHYAKFWHWEKKESKRTKTDQNRPKRTKTDQNGPKRTKRPKLTKNGSITNQKLIKNKRGKTIGFFCKEPVKSFPGNGMFRKMNISLYDNWRTAVWIWWIILAY